MSKKRLESQSNNKDEKKIDLADSKDVLVI